MNRYFRKEVKMTIYPGGKKSTSLITKDMHIKKAMQHHF